ncbi:MAG: triose-phosphate isomerase [Parcubacteria group bacterium RIFCSPLOWO2_01_FULL_48_18]|nr:MAG: triose-phosphate isomerase [Parcubacteria group bacterium RIFCSPLOWO2_01_FULL_48_18]
MSKKLIIANWKMSPSTYAKAETLFLATLAAARKLSRVETVVCPPFPWLTDISHKYKKSISFGAQDVFWEEGGAYTGEVSPTMLKGSGVKYVIIGHSERRLYLQETDEMINKKMLAALRAGLVPILCVGEWTRKGRPWKWIKNFVRKQLAEDLRGIAKIAGGSQKIVVAYEPVWAISTFGGGPDKPEDSLKIIKFIKGILDSRFQIPDSKVIYGGSVNAKNAVDFLKYPDVEGALVGGASLRAGEFGKILSEANLINAKPSL